MSQGVNLYLHWLRSSFPAMFALAATVLLTFALLSLGRPGAEGHSIIESLLFSAVLAGAFGALASREAHDISVKSREAVHLWLLSFAWGILPSFLLFSDGTTSNMHVIHPLYETIIITLGFCLAISCLSFIPLELLKSGPAKGA
jgi:membrane protease YdiL (CAAX protease family)